MSRFNIIIECLTPDDVNEREQYAYASSMLEHIRRPLYVEGVGYVLKIDDIRYEFEKPLREEVDRIIDSADSHLRNMYNEDVALLGKCMTEDAQSGEFKSVEEFDESLDAHIEGSQRMCNVRKLHECLMYTDYVDAYHNEHGDHGDIDSTAAAAFKADILDWLNGNEFYTDRMDSWKKPDARSIVDQAFDEMVEDGEV